jgi:hypothetical protein
MWKGQRRTDDIAVECCSGLGAKHERLGKADSP